MENVIIGSNKIDETREDNFELVSYRGLDGGFTHVSKFRSLAFIALSDCTVRVNGGQDILIQEGETLEFDKETISSFIINESGTKYRYIAAV